MRPWQLFLGFIAIVLALAVVEHRARTGVADEARIRSEFNCAIGNLRSAYELANRSDGPYRERLVHDTLPIIDCQASFDKADEYWQLVPVSRAVQDRFVRIVERRRRWPQIENGRIVSTTPLPAAFQRK